MSADTLARLALVGLDGISPARLAWLLTCGSATDAVAALRAGRYPDCVGPAPSGLGRGVIGAWSAELRKRDLDAELADHRSRGIALVGPEHERWPFATDPHPPTLLFAQGELGLLGASSSVAVVGTRRCTTVGRTVAYQFGADLAGAGCTVVSGLALGVDGSAHRGAIDRGGPVIGVVGSGLDIVYPGGNRDLWETVAADGLLLSETPVGGRPKRWRFPARNRLIAGLSAGVVIVESHRRGGALITGDEAAERGRPVFAVPGSVLSAASDGTNALLIDGAIPARDAADVLTHLGVGCVAPRRSQGTAADAASALVDVVLAEAATGPVHVDRLVRAAGIPAASLLAALRELEAAGIVLVDGATVSLPPGDQP